MAEQHEYTEITKTERDNAVNGVFMAIEKELRKHGLVSEFHDHGEAHRMIVAGMINTMIAEREEKLRGGKQPVTG